MSANVGIISYGAWDTAIGTLPGSANDMIKEDLI